MESRDSSSFCTTDFMSTPTSCPSRLTALPATNTESTFDVSAKVTIVALRVEHRRGVDRVRLEQDDVGLLARRERADLVLEHDRPGAVDGRELEHVRVRELRRERDVRRVGELEDPVVGERRPHLREHLAGNARDDVDAQRGANAAGEHLPDRRRPVAHQHLDVRRDRRLAAGLGDPVELLVGEVGHVDVADVRPHQPEVVHVLHGLVVEGVEPHADVHADEDPELARERPVVLRDVEVHVAGLARRHARA